MGTMNGDENDDRKATWDRFTVGVALVAVGLWIFHESLAFAPERTGTAQDLALAAGMAFFWVPSFGAMGMGFVLVLLSLTAET